jgi:hypothetical protein
MTIPAMHRVLADERILPYEGLLGRNLVRQAADEVFGRVRASNGETAYDAIVDDVAARL